MKNFLNTKNLARTAMVAALYGCLTWALSFMAYGPIQFRLTEVMVLLVLIDSGYIPGLVLGCIIANIFSSVGIMDMVFGSAATLISVLLISKTKNLWVATLWPTICNALIVGAELYYISHLPFFLSAGEVALGEFVVVTILGGILFTFILKNKKLVNMLKFS